MQIKISALTLLVVVAVQSFGCTKHDAPLDVKKTIAEADAKHPDNPSASINEKVNDYAESQMQGRSEAERKAMAGAAFIGYYTKYVVVFPEVCKANGVAISKFPELFAEQNREVLAVARASVGDWTLKPEAFQSMRLSSEHELNVIAKNSGRSVADACSDIESNHQAVAVNTHPSKLMPSAYAILTRRTQ